MDAKEPDFSRFIDATTRALITKQKRSYSSIVKAHKCCPFSATPTRFLFVANCGGQHRITLERLLKLFSGFGTIADIHWTSLLPFVLLEFANADESKAARTALHMKECAELDKRLLFLEFGLEEHARLCAVLDSSDDQTGGWSQLRIANAISLHRTHPRQSPSLHDLRLGWASANDPSETLAIPGLLLIREFVSADEEATLLRYLDSQPWISTRLRQVQHHGIAFDYSLNSVQASKPIERFPTVFAPLVARLARLADDPGDCVRVLADEASCEQTKLEACAGKADAKASPSNASSTSSDSKASSAHADSAFPCFAPEQLTVNKYAAGDSIPPHVDTHSSFTNLIVSLSLGSQIVMDLRRQSTDTKSTAASNAASAKSEAASSAAPSSSDSCSDATVSSAESKQLQRIVSPRKQDTSAHIAVVLPARSLLVLKGEARFAWSHAIAPRKVDLCDGRLHDRTTRVSLTFRRLRAPLAGQTKPLCDCAFPQLCDAHVSSLQANSSAKSASERVDPSSAVVSLSDSAAACT